MNNTDIREQLAAIEHERWADWQKWCHKVLRENNPSPEIGDVLERWDRQIETPYAELSDSEKASDMKQVDRYWPLIEKLITDSNLALLNRLEASSREYSVVDAELFEHRNGQDQELIPLSALQAERNLLEESTDA